MSPRQLKEKPHRLERPLLAGALTSGTVAEILTAELRPDHFTGAHAVVFNGISASVAKTGGADVRTVTELMAEAGISSPYEMLAAILGEEKSILLPGDGLRAAMEELRRCRIRESASRFLKAGDLDRARKVLAEADAAPAGVVSNRITPGETARFLAMVQSNAGKKLLGFSTGLHRLDAVTHGLIPSFLWGAAAPTGGGKTTFLSQITINPLLAGAKCAFFSLEMSRDWMLARLIGAYLRINPARIYRWELTDSEKLRVEGTFQLLQDLPLYLFRHEQEIAAICHAARNVKAREGRVDVIVIDFLQLVTVRGVGNVNERMMDAVVQLQSLAGEIDACVLVASQLSNETVREKGRGILSFRYASELGHACDVGIELVPNTDGTTELRLKKNRHGRVGKIVLRMAGGWSCFEEVPDGLAYNTRRGQDAAAGEDE